MRKEELKERAKKFALVIIKLVGELPNTNVGRTISNQIIRLGTSVRSKLSRSMSEPGAILISFQK